MQIELKFTFDSAEEAAQVLSLLSGTVPAPTKTKVEKAKAESAPKSAPADAATPSASPPTSSVDAPTGAPAAPVVKAPFEYATLRKAVTAVGAFDPNQQGALKSIAAKHGGETFMKLDPSVWEAAHNDVLALAAEIGVTLP